MADVTGNPLLFTKTTLLDAKIHRDWKIQPATDFNHCRGIRFLPVTLSEFSQVALEQPIVFVEDGDIIVPVAVLGLNDTNNLFIDETGIWDGRYVPAYARMYPFILAPRKDGKGYIVCIDGDYPGFSTQNGSPLFDDQGEQTDFTRNAIAFASEYQRQREQAIDYTALLKGYDLLEPAGLKVKTGPDETISVGGFLTVSREKLAALENDQVTKLFALGRLEPTYLQLASLSNFDQLSRRLATLTRPAVDPPSAAVS